MTEKKFQLDDNFLGSTQNYISSWCEENSVHPKISTRIAICCDEILSNVKFYSNATFLNIKCSLTDNLVSLTFDDDGIPFNPLTDSEEPDITAPIEERKIGGLGIFMVKKMMNSISYKNEGGHNILKMEIQNNA